MPTRYFTFLRDVLEIGQRSLSASPDLVNGKTQRPVDRVLLGGGAQRGRGFSEKPFVDVQP